VEVRLDALAELEQRLGEMTEVGEAVCVDGLATGCNDGDLL